MTFASDRLLVIESQAQIRESIVEHMASMHRMQVLLHRAAAAKDRALRVAWANQMRQLVGEHRPMGSDGIEMDLVGDRELIESWLRLLDVVPADWCARLARIHIRLETGPRSSLWLEPGGCLITCDGSDRQILHMIAHMVEITQPQMRQALRRQIKRLRTSWYAPVALPSAVPGDEDLARARWRRYFWNVAGPGEVLAVFCELLMGEQPVELDAELMNELVTLWLTA
jgi:hypothetical protein